jgi:hypothetical protein
MKKILKSKERTKPRRNEMRHCMAKMERDSQITKIRRKNGKSDQRRRTGDDKK